MVRGMKDPSVLQLFFTKLRSLQEMRGISEPEFDPLESFHKKGRTVPRLSWSLSTDQAVRDKFIDFLKTNDTKAIKLVGGTIDAVIEVPTLYHENLKEFYAREMPNMNLTEVFKTLPPLEKFHINSLPLVTEEVFNTHIFASLTSYKGLNTFNIELLEYDIEKS
jgi:hypothetical protein